MKTPFYVFLLGTPGCGKSEVYRRLSRRIQEERLAKDVLRVDDYPKIHACFAEDDRAELEGRRRLFSKKGEAGGWIITDSLLWDHVLKMVNDDLVRERKAERSIFVEFARPDMVRSIRDNFEESVLRSSLVLYIYCPFEICWERNVRRHEAAIAAGTDDHLVSKEEMEATYLRDDHDRLHKLGIPFLLIDNHREGTDLLECEIEKVLTALQHD